MSRIFAGADAAQVSRGEWGRIGCGCDGATGERTAGAVGGSQSTQRRAAGGKQHALDAENPSSVWSPETDNGTVEPFKYSFALAHKRIEDGGWTRQVTERELPISKTLAGVEMRLINGGVRELHWHTSAEWAFMIYGNARITAVDAKGRSFVNDVTKGDLWLFPGGIPHSIQGLGPDGAMFLLVFNDGGFNEFETFLLTDWFKHTPKDVLAKNFNVPASTFDNVPKKELFIFATEPPRPLAEEQKAAAEGTGAIDGDYVFQGEHHAADQGQGGRRGAHRGQERLSRQRILRRRLCG